MSSNQYTRERKEDKPVLAICYDFDKTLSPDDMQAQGYIQSVGYDVGEFWTESNGLASQNDMDQNLAYMLLMKKKAAGKLVFTRENLENYGAKVSLFPGVEDWFERIRTYGAEHGVIVEHYIISSGLKEMIEGTSVAKNGAFKRIYASSFYEVFISHSSVDLAFSRAIATDLMDAGFSVFLDDWSINIGERIFEKISTGLRESKALIMIISKDYLKSVCCTDEWGAFYGKALHDKSCVIYPIIIDDSAPPALISQIKYLRFNGDEYASALSTLLRSLRKQFSK